MNIGPAASTLIMVINYSHDIATALLAVSGITLWILSSAFPLTADAEAGRFFVRAYGGTKKLARYSLEWILIAGVPRIVFYTRFEWAEQAGDLQVLAIIIKHVVMFSLVGMGIFFWIRLNRKVSRLAENQGHA